MLKVEGLTGGYGSSKVLFGMAFEAAEGEVISLIGRNGMGKTLSLIHIFRLEGQSSSEGTVPIWARMRGDSMSPVSLSIMTS